MNVRKIAINSDFIILISFQPSLLRGSEKYITVEELDSLSSTSVLDMTLNDLIVRLE